MRPKLPALRLLEVGRRRAGLAAGQRPGQREQLVSCVWGTLGEASGQVAFVESSLIVLLREQRELATGFN